MPMQLLETTAIRAPRRVRLNFFSVAAGVVLILVAIGFSPTLYLRPMFPVPPIPGYLYLHGLVLTAWFVLSFAQSLLIGSGQVARHRKLGTMGAIVGGAVVLASAMTALLVASRVAASGVDFASDASILGTGVSGVSITAFVSFATFASLAAILNFTILLSAGVLFRREAATHKRLMLLASLSIIQPALSRISLFRGPTLMLVFVGLLLTVWLYDILTRKRPHLVTVLGTALIFAVSFGADAFSRTEAAQSIILGLR